MHNTKHTVSRCAALSPACGCSCGALPAQNTIPVNCIRAQLVVMHPASIAAVLPDILHVLLEVGVDGACLGGTQSLHVCHIGCQQLVLLGLVEHCCSI